MAPYPKRIALLIASMLITIGCERPKRADLDLPTCIGKFNVHKDKIIRTQDSQNMGAKYLNEMDLGSREECLHLCCETDDCDVFVFEEKNAGSCYLFHCGPPEDFKCKFTHHVNYSSAILSINRHPPDLESQIKLTKHEQDLTKLRKSDSEPEAPVQQIIRTTPAITTTTTPQHVREIIPVNNNNNNNNKKPGEEDSKCTRFQFECRSTGECIAIYNACDGIPQCADGSDEGPELGCPESSSSVLTTAPPSLPVQPLIRYNNVKPINANPQGLYQQQQQQQLVGDNGQLTALRPDANFLRPASDNMNSRLPYENPVLQPYVAQLPAQGQPNWLGRQSNQLPPQIAQYVDKSRIFNHKESGYQMPDGPEIRYNNNNHKGAMRYLHRALGLSSIGGQSVASYPKMANYYPENGYVQPVQPDNWPSEGVYAESTNIKDNRGQKIEYKFTPGREQQQQVLQQQPPIIKTDEGTNPKHVQDQLAHDLKHSKHNMEHMGSTRSNNKSPAEQRQRHDEEQYPDVIAYKYSGADDLEDGVAQTQKGAVLSVSLGLIITFVMAVFIGCRLKVVRRRMRKGGKAYAHDADFLVNGMYL
ncbi:unnamed protein product [Phyllotreta striolata]|uniref:MANSC domain-containing protein n=1 Tax=Phyllotreta striolata TaxID=444603 RepID=A0A9N9TVE3_PHYSR|nr:unnamed protein product [Phyllotreta striolata]